MEHTFLYQVLLSLCGIVCAGLGWQINIMKKDIEDLRINKADHKDFDEIKKDLKQIIENINEIQLAQARQAGRQDILNLQKEQQ